MQQAQAHSYVTSATITGNQLTFQVEVGDFNPNQVVEISGQATQVGGAFAPIFAVKTVPAEPNGDSGEYYVDVTATTMGEYPFRKDQAVTVFVRVSIVWVTVLGEHNMGSYTEPAGQDADDGTTWDLVRKVSQLNDDSWPGQGSQGR